MVRSNAFRACLYAIFGTAMLSLTTACTQGPKLHAASGLKGFSADSSASNVAVMLTASSSTPGNAWYFADDMNSFYALLSSPSGNWRFRTSVAQEAASTQMNAAIASAASQVDANGTLLIFITAHGSPGGTIEADDGTGYATYGYGDILNAIRSGRNGRPFRRLVLIVSACYSGSWFNTLVSSNGLFKERLVVSSVTSGELSTIGQATHAMLAAFQAQQRPDTLTVGQFFNGVQQIDPSVRFSAVPDSLYNEPFINPVSNPRVKDNSDSSDSRTIVDNNKDQPKPSDQPSNDQGTSSNTQAPDIRLLVGAMGNQTALYVYSSKPISDVAVYAADGNWYAAQWSFAAQPGWPFIEGIPVDSGWNAFNSAQIRYSVDGQMQTAVLQIFH